MLYIVTTILFLYVRKINYLTQWIVLYVISNVINTNSDLQHVPQKKTFLKSLAKLTGKHFRELLIIII